ncbi:hypothetical protein ICV35_23900 [Rhodococcus ruber]|uniref:hypothetical protein n=1 Tax=Rhodococcus ruber TaxID=1830 RepID=UPI00177B73AB|nr:hypothetical protein [Rhodococcus ruber]MBD8056696.1 hypothetical protein [Rhodococcus ruber]
MNLTHSAHDTVARDHTTGQRNGDTQTALARGAQLPAARAIPMPTETAWRDSTSEDGHRSCGIQSLPAVFGPNFPAASVTSKTIRETLRGFNFRRTISYAVPKKLPFGGFNLPHLPLLGRYPTILRWCGNKLPASPSA